MPAVYEDIIASLNELKDHAEGKPTGVLVHRRSSQDPVGELQKRKIQLHGQATDQANQTVE